MSSAIGLSATVRAYLAKSVREHPALTRCRRDTGKMPHAEMQIAPEQGALMGLLAKLTGAKRYLEIGSFTGYSALAVALALPKTGRVVCLDISEKYLARARMYWRAAGVAGQIETRIGPAVRTLDTMIAARENPFDMAFIDADKENYGRYYERVLTLMGRGRANPDRQRALVRPRRRCQGQRYEHARHSRAQQKDPRRCPRRHGARDRGRRPDDRAQALKRHKKAGLR